MERINQELFRRLVSRTGKARSRVYSLIEQRVRATSLPPNLAAITLAWDYGINISRYATPAQLAEIRATTRAIPSSGGPSSTAGVAMPRESKLRGKGPSKSKGANRLADSVFVVHGRQEQIRVDLFSLLRSLGLKPLEWQKALELTKKGAPYVGEVLDTAFARATAVIVLLTPDDDARLKPALQRQGDPSWERKLSGQPRPNVLFEAGMAFGSHPQSTILVNVGRIRPFSDVGGRHVVHLTGSPESRRELVTKLRASGCQVDDSGTDWLKVGNFNNAL